MKLPKTVHQLCNSERVLQLVGLPYDAIMASQEALNYVTMSRVPPTDLDGLIWFEIRANQLTAAKVQWIYDEGGKVGRSIFGDDVIEMWPAAIELPWSKRNNQVPVGVVSREYLDENEETKIYTWLQWQAAGKAPFQRSIAGIKAIMILSFSSMPLLAQEVLAIKAAGGTVLSKLEAREALEPGGEYVPEAE